MALVVSQASQPNITSVGTLTGLYSTGNLSASFFVGGGNTLSNINASNLAFGLVNSTLIYGNTLSNIQFSNVTGLLPNTISNLNASNLSFGIVNSSLIYGNTLSNISGSNITTGINASNITTGILSSSLIYANTLSNIESSNITQPFTNLVVSNSVTTTRIFAQNLYISAGIDVIGEGSFHENLIVDGNLIPGAIIDSESSAGYAGQLLSSTGSSIKWSSNLVVSNLAVSNSVTTTNIFTTGNVGIGTFTPGAMLDVVTTASPGAGALIAQFGTSASARLQFYDENGGLPPYIYGAAGNGLGLSSSGAIKFYPGGSPGITPTMIVDQNSVHIIPDLYVGGNIYCSAFTTSTATNWNYVSNAATARSTSVGWQGLRQVFGDQVTGSVYVYFDTYYETMFASSGSGSGSFVAIGGETDNIIVVSGVDKFYVYYNDGVWNGPVSYDTTEDLGTYSTLWMPSLGANNTLVIGGYGWLSAAGVGNPSVGVYTINTTDGSSSFIGPIVPPNATPDLNRNTVAISGDENVVAIGSTDASRLYIYRITSSLSVSEFTDNISSDFNDYVSINYDGTIVLVTLQNTSKVLMYSNYLTPV